MQAETSLNQREVFIKHMKTLGIGICVIFIAVVTGPLAIGLALLFQWWCASCQFDSRDNWDSMRVFAWLLGIPASIFYLADIIFHSQVVHHWVRSPLHGLGSPTADNLVFLWIVGLVWSPALTFLIEEGRPQTIRRFLRVKTDDEKQAEKQREKQHFAREQAEKQAAEQRAVERRKNLATIQHQVKTVPVPSRSAQTPEQQKPKGQRTIEEQRRDEWLKEQAAHRARQTPPETQPRSTVEQQTTPPSLPSKKKEKPDWGDGDMSSLL